MRLLLAAVAAVALTAPAARAQLAEEASGIRTPARHTAGDADQFMGHLAPNGHDVYFVSDRHSTFAPFVVDIRRGAPAQVFEHDADVTALRVSPDGDRLLFISYRSDALGDACVRDLDDGETTCLTGSDTAEVQAFWFPDGRSVGVVSRDGLHADYRLLRIPAGGGEPEVLADRNVASPAVSPDGRWIAYVPLARGSDAVGIHFAMRATQRMELIRPSDGHRLSVPVDLPGVSGFPAFSPDGRWLYFSQYLNDTNFDGRVDGDDHSVLFRVPFDSDADAPVGDAGPEQLTSAGWSCQYAAPAPERLVMTCAIGGSLDVWSLPLDGAVASDAGEATLEGELHAARDHWEKLLLLGRLLAGTTERDARIDRLRTMIRLHLELREYGSADWYARRLAGLAGEGDGLRDMAAAIRELIGFRREESRLVEGQLSRAFLDAQRKRLARVRALEEEATGPAADLARLVSADIHDVIGEKSEALASFEAVDLEALEDPFVLAVVGDRAARLLRPLGLRDRLLEVFHRLSTKRGFDSLERLRWADRLVRELVRGRDRERRQGLVEAWLERVEEGSEAALLLQVHGWLNGLTPESSEWVRAGLFDIYQRNKDPDRRKALVLTTVGRALDQDDRYLAYEFANSWASWLKRAHAERKYAEALYTRVVLERAYDGLGEGEISDARGTFYGATLISEALEPHVGFIEARLREGHDDVEALYAKRWDRRSDPVAQRFVTAYLLAREVPGITDRERLGATVEAAVEHLRAAAEARPQSLEVHHLWGTLMHHLYAVTGDPAHALEAHTHYRIALGPARSRPRYLAPLLQQLGLLQAGLGNHRIAVRWLERRVAMPFLDPATEVSARLGLARSLFHMDRDDEAASEATQALEIVDAHDDLERLRPVALDQAALYHHVAGRSERARDLYAALIPLLEAAPPDDAGRPLNRLKARIGRASAAMVMGAPADALPDLAEARGILDDEAPLEPEGAGSPTRAVPSEYDRGDYRVLVAGLEARAHQALGDGDAARVALERRRDLLADQAPVRERLARLGKTHYDLAHVAWTRDDREATRRHLEAGLRAMDRYREETSTPVTFQVLHLLQGYAELHLDMGVPRGALELDLRRRLREVFEFITTHRAPAWEGHRFLLAQYLTLLDLEQPDPEPPRGGAP